jgi:hypothetical protein
VAGYIHGPIVCRADGSEHPIAPRGSEGSSDNITQRGYAGRGVETVGALRELDLLAQSATEVHLLEQALSRHAI